MHYGNGIVTRCRDVLESEFNYCSDLNTTHFLRKMIHIEKPDLIVFTGNNFDFPFLLFETVTNMYVLWIFTRTGMKNRKCTASNCKVNFEPTKPLSQALVLCLEDSNSIYIHKNVKKENHLI